MMLAKLNSLLVYSAYDCMIDTRFFFLEDPKITLEEMDAHLLPLKRRDYCAYMYIKFLDCKRDNKWPYLPCDLVFQDFQACEHEE